MNEDEELDARAEAEYRDYGFDQIREKVEELEQERDTLLRWKQEAIHVIEQWEKVANALGVHAQADFKPSELGKSRAALALDVVLTLFDAKGES